MTLLEGTKTMEGWVLCADSQETVGEYRVSRQKITPWSAGSFQIAMAGSGNNGELIDAFEERLRGAIEQSQIQSLEALKDLIHIELLEFQKTEASAYPRKDRQMRFLIAARSLAHSRAVLWSTSASRLIPVNRHELVGFEDERYRFAADAYLRTTSEITTAQGIFLGLHIMWLAEKTSNYVKAPVSVVIVRDNGIFAEKQPRIDALLERVKIFAAQFDQIFLACPDTGLRHGEFAARINEFVKTIAHLRREYVEEWVGEAVEEGLDKIIDPYTLIAPDTTIIINPTSQQALAQQQMQSRLSGALRENAGHIQEKDQLISTLGAIRVYQEKVCAQCAGGDGPTPEEVQQMNTATAEVFQAALMGAWKIDETAVNLLHRVNGAMQRTVEDIHGYVSPEMRAATERLRLAIVDRALAYIQRPTPSVSQTSTGQP